MTTSQHSAQSVHALEQEARKRGVGLRIEKLDVTQEGDRVKAAEWNVDVLYASGQVI